jgi:hypothetical protein
VADEALKNCVAEIRRALRDTANEPRFIETVHRRGYRFIGELGRQRRAGPPKSEDLDGQQRGPDFSGCQVVGRAVELSQLHQYLEKAIGGIRRVVFVAGVAAALGKKVEPIEVLCRTLAKRNLFLLPANIHRSPGRKRGGFYRFSHGLYQNICYQHLPEDLRVLLHRRIAKYIERVNRTRPDDFAAQLAVHYEQMRQSLAGYREIGFTNIRSYLSAMFAETLGDAGQIEDGLIAIQDALDVSCNTGMHYHEVEIYRLRGELLLKQISNTRSDSRPEHNPKVLEAKSCFEQAINIARHQNAKSFELRATISLARLLQIQNRQEEAKKRLLTICEWFTEGHDTADQHEARNLLRALD